MKQFQTMRIFNQKMPRQYQAQCLMTRLNLDRWLNQRREHRHLAKLHQSALDSASEQNSTFFADPERAAEWAQGLEQHLQDNQSALLHLPVNLDLMDQMALAWMTSRASTSPSRRH